MLFSRPKRVGKLIRQGDEAQRRGDWRTAYRCYDAIVTARPEHVAIWVQLGHAAKELGDVDRAEQAYREALQRGGGHADTYTQLGHLLKQSGSRERAIAAYADALRLDPDAAVPLQHLASLGARDAVPDAVFADARRERLAGQIAAKFGELQQMFASQTEASTFPLRRYDLFRRVYPVPPPRGSASPGGIVVLVDARHALPSSLRATLVSLLDQSFSDWTARVRLSGNLADHPVAGFAVTETRIDYIASDESIDIDPDAWVLSVPAGVSLDPQCLAWFAFATSVVDADAFHADHDHVIDDPAIGSIRAHPCLYGAFDPFVMVQTSTPPLAMMTRGRVLSANDDGLRLTAVEMNRRLLLAVGEEGRIATIPRILASLVGLPDALRGARNHDDPDMPVASGPHGAPADGERFLAGGGVLELRRGPGADPVVVAVPSDDDAFLRVVIPSRDAAALLRTAVDRLLACASRADRVRLTIVDNRSSNPEALALLDEYRRRGIDVLVMDEPFNWSRANNLAAAASHEPYLVFVNNDTEMQTAEWDRLVVGYLERDIGAVGARLLYPDRTLQHGGTIFLGNSPRHEGVGVAEDVSGPLGRWAATRLVGAVTGAFLAVRRDRFDAVDGFDEQRLAIAFNDVDFCLKLRSRGWPILYAASIELIHHESKTRGHSDTRAKMAWDLEEFRTLRERWTDALACDPGYNPQWTDGPVPFDGLREPPMSCVIHHIERSARRDPWLIDAPTRT